MDGRVHSAYKVRLCAYFLDSLSFVPGGHCFDSYYLPHRLRLLSGITIFSSSISESASSISGFHGSRGS